MKGYHRSFVGSSLNMGWWEQFRVKRTEVRAVLLMIEIQTCGLFVKMRLKPAPLAEQEVSLVARASSYPSSQDSGVDLETRT